MKENYIKKRIRYQNILNRFEDIESLGDGLFINYQCKKLNNYKSYCIVKDEKSYKIKEVVNNFSPTVYYIINEKPAIKALNYFLKNKDNNIKSASYNDISRNIQLEEKILKEHNIIEKEFIFGENNYRVTLEGYNNYSYTIDTNEQVINAIYYSSKDDVILISNELNKYI